MYSHLSQWNLLSIASFEMQKYFINSYTVKSFIFNVYIEKRRCDGWWEWDGGSMGTMLRIMSLADRDLGVSILCPYHHHATQEFCLEWGVGTPCPYSLSWVYSPHVHVSTQIWVAVTAYTQSSSPWYKAGGLKIDTDWLTSWIIWIMDHLSPALTQH